MMRAFSKQCERVNAVELGHRCLFALLGRFKRTLRRTTFCLWGWVAEWLKAHAWKACARETVSRVRISPHPLQIRRLSPLHGAGFFVTIGLVPDNFPRLVREQATAGDPERERELSAVCHTYKASKSGGCCEH